MIISKIQGQFLGEVGTDWIQKYFSHTWLALKLVPQKAYIYCHQQENQQM
jgi:hypothetical protein